MTLHYEASEAGLNEVLFSMRQKVKPVLYKYRSYEDKYHKRAITHSEIYFAHPKSLNDPYDIRVPVEFDLTEINEPLFFEKLKQVIAHMRPDLATTSPEFMAVCVDKMAEIRRNPREYFEKNYRAFRESSAYDSFGLFSVTEDELNPTMWAHYGNNNKGFCIGYDPVAIYRFIICSFGSASYRARPHVHSFLKPITTEELVASFFKDERWSYEKEHRFIVMSITSDQERAVRLPTSFIKEVVIGKDTSSEDQHAIADEVMKVYGGNVKLFTVKEKASGYGYEKVPV